MCADKSDFFHCPAYKLMISDLLAAVPAPSNKPLHEAEDSEYEWTLKITHIPNSDGKMISLESLIKSRPFIKLDLKLVWIQGKVIRFHQMNKDSEYLSLVITDDEKEGNTAVLHEYTTVPGGDHPDIKIGAYVGTLGQLWSNADNTAVIKAAKIMYLGDKPLLKTVWSNEVRLAKSFLAGLILPTIV